MALLTRIQLHCGVFVTIICCSIFIRDVYGQCSLPTFLQNSVWIDSDKGELVFGETNMTGWGLDYTNNLGDPLTEWNCFFTVADDSKIYLVLQLSQNLTILQDVFSVFMCMELTKVTDYSYYYYLLWSDTPPTFNYDRISGQDVNTTITDPRSQVCLDPNNPLHAANYPTVAEYHVLLKNDSVEAAIQECPDSYFGEYVYTIEDIDNNVETCGGDSDVVDVCTDYTKMAVNNTVCGTALGYTENGSLACIMSFISGDYIYHTVYNQDSNVDGVSTHRFTCFVSSLSPNGSVTASQVPGSCKKDQTPYSQPLFPNGSIAGLNIEFVPNRLCPKTSDASSESGLSTGAIVGIIFGVLLFIAAVIILVCILKKCRKPANQKELPETKSAPQSPRKEGPPIPSEADIGQQSELWMPSFSGEAPNDTKFSGTNNLSKSIDDDFNPFSAPLLGNGHVHKNDQTGISPKTSSKSHDLLCLSTSTSPINQRHSSDATPNTIAINKSTAAPQPLQEHPAKSTASESKAIPILKSENIFIRKSEKDSDQNVSGTSLIGSQSKLLRHPSPTEEAMTMAFKSDKGSKWFQKEEKNGVVLGDTSVENETIIPKHSPHEDIIKLKSVTSVTPELLKQQLERSKTDNSSQNISESKNGLNIDSRNGYCGMVHENSRHILKSTLGEHHIISRSLAPVATHTGSPELTDLNERTNSDNVKENTFIFTNNRSEQENNSIPSSKRCTPPVIHVKERSTSEEKPRKKKNKKESKSTNKTKSNNNPKKSNGIPGTAKKVGKKKGHDALAGMKTANLQRRPNKRGTFYNDNITEVSEPKSFMQIAELNETVYSDTGLYYDEDNEKERAMLKTKHVEEVTPELDYGTNDTPIATSQSVNSLSRISNITFASSKAADSPKDGHISRGAKYFIENETNSIVISVKSVGTLEAEDSSESDNNGTDTEYAEDDFEYEDEEIEAYDENSENINGIDEVDTALAVFDTSAENEQGIASESSTTNNVIRKADVTHPKVNTDLKDKYAETVKAMEDTTGDSKVEHEFENKTGRERKRVSTQEIDENAETIRATNEAGKAMTVLYGDDEEDPDKMILKSYDHDLFGYEPNLLTIKE